MATDQLANDKIKKPPPWAGWLFLALGFLFIAGAYIAATSGEWPIFLPPQVDVLSLFFGLFGKPLGGYLASVFLFALGVGSGWLGLAAIRMENHA